MMRFNTYESAAHPEESEPVHLVCDEVSEDDLSPSLPPHLTLGSVIHSTDSQ